MSKRFRVTFKIKTTLRRPPKPVDGAQNPEAVRELIRTILADENTLNEVYKTIFFDLLSNQFYTGAIEEKACLKKESELIVPISEKMKTANSTFFKELFTSPPKEELMPIADSIMNSFYSRFGCPEIEEIRFESLDKGFLA